ncbi:PTS glucose transporter subunit IIA [Gracilibacillus caseinilyticus]|uniref:PTS glucose transporter subunit IIA n=1 Tax=Gracilibacillus caseinilyticus TaxID=2932256 RepID=A0ABY4F5B3_9BACI|nr:PTS glucose transporter subunit IIA [Gracilibacillus caseinilyticus]UOQ49646.1 PTS glucose transporter subunit IIA [Gracilibacillus caseinilyticus]
MFKNLFGKKETIETLLAPLTGKLVNMEDVPDEMFSKKLLGDGLAIEPMEGTVVAPVDGEVVQFSDTKHAVGIQSKNGLELLIHIGLETVALKGEGFEGHVSQGEKVKAGDKLVTFDLPFIKEKADSIISPIVITNFVEVESLKKSEETNLVAGESTLMTVSKK